MNFDLRGTYIAISVPCYRGVVPIEWAIAFAATQDLLREYGVQSYLQTRAGSGLVHAVRNDLVHAALIRPRVTHVLFVDDDVVWEPDHVLRLAAWGQKHPFVCGVYPTKTEEDNFPVDLVRFPDGRLVMSEEGLLRASVVPGGFMLLRRDLFDRMTPEVAVSVPARGDLKGQSVRGYFDFMQCGEAALGEDVSFCKRWTDVGGEIWIDTGINLKHFGTKAYDASFVEYVKGQNQKVRAAA